MGNFKKRLILGLQRRGLLDFLSDKAYVKLEYLARMGKKLNLKNPETFTEKLQWLKLYDHNPEYSKMADKCEAKKYVASIIGEEYIIPTYGVYDNFDEIDFDSLPNQFVIKCTHDCGGLAICKDKKTFNIEAAKEKINQSLHRNYYKKSREWVYKNIKPRIIVEKYMEDKDSSSMVDYKFFSFYGEPKIMYMSEGLENHATATMSFFDMDFNLTDCKRKDYELYKYKPKKPKNFEKMKEFASILSKDIPSLRVDFYEINGHIYFGELTFITGGGYILFEDEKWNKKLGSYIDLSKLKKNSSK